MSTKVLLYGIIPLIVFGVLAFYFKSLIQLIVRIKNYRLGFEGERYVGAELNELMYEGDRVFHDFIFSMKPGGEKTDFNIDHIVVGSRGVFAIETKARRKPKQTSGGKAY